MLPCYVAQTVLFPGDQHFLCGVYFMILTHQNATFKNAELGSTGNSEFLFHSLKPFRYIWCFQDTFMGISCNYLIYTFPLFSHLHCEQKFLSCMAFSLYKVTRIACLLHRWFVYTLGDCLPNDSINAKSHARKRPLLTRHWTVQVTLTSSSSVFLLMRRGGGELPNNDTAPTGSWNATQSQSESIFNN